MRCEGICFDGLAVVIVHLELLLFVDRVHRFLADDDAFLEHGVAQQLADIGVVADGFGQDVARAFQRLLDARRRLFPASTKDAANVSSGDAVGS